MIIDAHLDLAYNVIRGRDVTRPAAEQPYVHNETATVGLPDLRAGGVGLVCATLFTASVEHGVLGTYSTPDEAHAAAMRQLDIYRDWQARGLIEVVTEISPDAAAAGDVTRAILLMENADPIRSPDEVGQWYDAGVRVVGMAWKQTRYAGGTGAPGPLTPAGVELVRAMDRVGMIHDASHLAEESFWQLMDLSQGPVIATHSNCRAIVPTDRQLSDVMIQAIAARDGVIGINFFDRFLLPPAEYGKRRATLADVVRHVQHICQLVGDTRHVGIGTDLDGGIGREQIPEEIETAADLPRVAEALSAGGFGDEDVRAVMSANWMECFRRYLPAG
jgi:membrane dipeptidase